MKNKTLKYRLWNKFEDIIYYIHVSQQIPSILTIRNIYISLLLLLGIISSIVLRTVSFDQLLSPFGTFICFAIILFSVFFILYVQYTVIFRIGHIIKHTPQFIRMIRNGETQNVQILSTYVFVNTIAVALSLWVLTRMLQLSNLTDIYIYTLFIGLIISTYLFFKHNQSLRAFNLNVKNYPLWMIFGLVVALFSLWVVVPIALSKLLITYSEVLERYNTRMREVLILPMSASNSVNGDDANTFVFESSNENSNTSPQKSGWVQTRSESNSNSILNTAESITSSNSEGTGIGNSIANASANLSEKNNSPSTRILGNSPRNNE